MPGAVLVANRGEIARRIVRTVRAMGLRAVVVHSQPDATLPFVREADDAVALPGAPAQAYRDIPALLAAARRTGAGAVHPGYGFLSESADFARAVTHAGLTWVGPAPEVIAAMGDKVRARNLAAAAGVPVAAGTTEPVREVAAATAAAARIGFPLMVKAAAGGGGMGMAVVEDMAALPAEVDRIGAFAQRLFGDPSLLLERFFPRVRHVEIQVLGLADGRVLSLGERDCSVQRRHQKLVEETPSPAVDDSLRERMSAAAVAVAESVGYRGAGTVECLLDVETGEVVFLEMNTRLQVEHPVTEAVLGIDLVEAQLLIASGEPPAFDVGSLSARGHAIELRVNAEDPRRFLPGPGHITRWLEPQGVGVRVDSGYGEGDTVTPFYDSLMAKVVVHGADRDEALQRARAAVAGFEIAGPKSVLPFHSELLDAPEFVSGDYDTGIVARLRA